MAHSWPSGGQPSVVLDHDAIQHENLLLRELVTVYQRLTGLALQNADTATVARLLAQRTSATVAVVSRGLEVIAVAGPGAADGAPAENEVADDSASNHGAAGFVRDHLASPRLGAVLRSTGQTRRSLRLPDVGGGVPVIVVPILVADDVPAYLVTFGGSEEGPGGDLNLLVAEHAATICGVMLGRERVVAAAARQVRDDLVEGLLLGGGRDNGEVTRWAAHLGYDPAADHRVLAVAVDTSAAARSAENSAAAWQRAAVAVEQYFTLRLAETITSIRADEVVVVLPDGQPPGSQHLAEGCVARMRDLFGDAVVTIGIGGTCREPAEIARSYGQARRTIDALARLGRQGEVVAFEELGIHRLLLQVPDLLELRAFATEVLGPLSAADRQRGTEFLATLSCYFRENGSPQRTAQSLHVHPNTVTYRLRRIRAITGLQLDTYRDRLMAQVALEIYHALGTDPLAPERSSS